MSDYRITAVRSFCTQPAGARLLIVKVVTSEPGLYGLGCATFTQRHRAVKAALDHHIAPLVVGRDPRDSGELWRLMMLNGYWRNGPVLNNAVSGVDMALWDIKGKLADLPCFQLWGGRARPAAAVYRHAGGNTIEEIAESAQRIMSDGVRYVRCQLGGYSGLGGGDGRRPQGAKTGAYFAPREHLAALPRLFEGLRKTLGDDVELLHDIHERLAPIDAVWLAKALEPFRLFFLEDILAPEDVRWFERVRAVCATPLAVGELFNNPQEITPLVAERLIDFIRVHVSQIGGVTPALKLAHLCEPFGVRTAWHGPGDTSPVGMAANVHLDVAIPNFGIQEWADRTPLEYDMFPGLPQVRNGYVYPPEAPGWGIDFDEALAARHPCKEGNPSWTEARTPDGALARP